MDKVLRHLAIANMIEGCIIVLMQVTTVSLRQIVISKKYSTIIIQ